MPVTTIEGPKLDVETKKNIIQDIAELLSKYYNIPTENFITYIKENEPDNVGVGIKTVTEMMKKE